MKLRKRNALTGLVALSFAVTAPLALAQQTGNTGSTPPQSQTGTAQGQAGTQTQNDAAMGAQQGAQARGGAQGQSWADLDSDGNNSISRTEAQAHAGLSGVFDQADTDGDGQLTMDEYRNYASQQGGAASNPN